MESKPLRPSMKADYYSILEISPVATDEVAHAAYRALAKLYSDDGAKMRALNEAKETILDKDKREEYDAERKVKKGKIIGNYRVISEIAEGGFGTTMARASGVSPEMKCVIAVLTNLRPHPTIQHLRIADVAGHQVVVGDHYEKNTLGIFIPEGALVSDKLAEEMWIKGKLAGKQKNRVKASERDGVRSEGLFYGSRFWTLHEGQRVYQAGPSWNPHWKDGDDVTEEIGVTFKFA